MSQLNKSLFPTWLVVPTTWLVVPTENQHWEISKTVFCPLIQMACELGKI